MQEKATNPGNLEIGRNLLRTSVKTKYNYTTEAGFNSIMETKTLNPSIGAKNARFGSGQYFTDIAPGSLTKGQTSYRLYGVPWNGNRLTHFLEIETSGLNIIKNKPFNFLHLEQLIIYFLIIVMANLRDKVMLSLAFIVLFGITCFSQNNYSSNIVLLVDDMIVTQKIDFDFYKKEELFYTHSYMLGKPLIVSKDLFRGDDVVLKFDYWQGVDKYEYAINFSVGWIDNTSYIIIKIYNLDKEMYREAFCKQKGKYVIEIKNSVYDMQVIKCKELKCKELKCN